MDEKVVGIIGGMGPEATVDLMARVIKATPAKDDVDHIRMVVDNNPKVPSRINALLEGKGESPAFCLQEMARKLAAWGVDFLAMPCNTAHFYHRDIQQAVSIPVLDMIALATEAVAVRAPGIQAVGLVASTAVLNLRIYEKAFAAHNLKILAPRSSDQDALMAAIRKIKTGQYGEDVRSSLRTAVDGLVQDGAQALLVACTELSVISGCIRTSYPVVDAAQILAEAIVREARQSMREET
ncbi:aspartate racemase [Desulfonatronum zhilinae]|nr:aspartate racemase [Desulfonatronum zhilinae]